MRRSTRLASALLALLMTVGTLSACKGGDDISADTTESETDTVAVTDPTTNEAVTTPDTEPSEENRDEPKTGSYTTTTNLSLPAYTFGESEEQVVYAMGGDEADSVFGIYNDPIVDGAHVTMKKSAVNGIYTRVSSSGTAPVTYTFDLTYGCPESEGSWITVYLGMRLSEGKADATGHNGVWMAMRNNKIGIRVGDWPNTAYADVDLDFAAGAGVAVVDDPVSNVITIYKVAEDGARTEVAHIAITDTHIELYAGDATEPAQSDPIVNAIPRDGYSHLWSHCIYADATVENYTVSLSRVLGDQENDGIIPANRDVLSDTWVAVDGAGRTVTSADVGTANDKKVGIFYFLWHEANKNGMPLYNHTEAYLTGGMDSLWSVMQDGPLGFAHYWAEPYFGYYASDDEWVLRKHASQLVAAGVDFVYFDATNGILYEQSYETLLKVWSQMRAEGLDTPQIAFLCAANETEFKDLWNNLYAPGRYEDLWFRWNGKPLILFTGGITLPEEARDFFTVRTSWANTADSWYTSTAGVGCWAWADMYKQRPGFALDANGKRVVEQMVVMCGFWANGSYGTNGGRSYSRTGGGIPSYEGDWDLGFALMNTTSGLGLGFQEQFDYAIQTDPDLIMITGWNEWWAGRWEGAPAIGQTIANGYTVSGNAEDKEYNYFVDCFNTEYSRDIEAMKGGFGDNYYYQMVQNIRTYKGARNVETAFGQWAIDLNGSVGQWYAVGPEYRDNSGDTAHRDHPSHVGSLHYTNTTGRNDLVTAKVSSDSTYLYFYVECAEDITAAEGTNWMNLFLKTDGDDTTGWNGFDYILNRSRDGATVSVERFTDNGWSFATVGTAEYIVSGNVMQIKVEKALVGAGTTFDFKWADNSVADGDIMEFIDLGDAAPDGRFCYRYTTEESVQKTPEGLTADMVVLKANGYNAYVNGAQVRLVDDNTKATAMASGYDVWLPVSFLKDALGIDATGEETYNHYGVEYVRATDLVQNAGKVITVTSDGLIVIADAAVEDASLLTTLYRALS